MQKQYSSSLGPYKVMLSINKVKDDDCIDFGCADINCSLCLRLKNGKLKLFNCSEELDSC